MHEGEKIHGVEKYKAESALRDFEGVHGHKQDPHLMKAVKHLAKQKKAMLGALADDEGDDEDERPNSIKEVREKARKKAPKNDD